MYCSRGKLPDTIVTSDDRTNHKYQERSTKSHGTGLRLVSFRVISWIVFKFFSDPASANWPGMINCRAYSWKYLEWLGSINSWPARVTRTRGKSVKRYLLNLVALVLAGLAIPSPPGAAPDKSKY